MGLSVNRVNIRKKYYWVLRNNGNILDKRHWSPKKTVKDNVFSTIKTNSSLHKEKINNVLVNVVEKIVKTRKKVIPKIVRRKSYMVEVRLFNDKGQEGFGRSRNLDSLSHDEKRKEAFKRAMQVYQGKVLQKGAGSDPDTRGVERLIFDGKLQAEERVVYYAKA